MYLKLGRFWGPTIISLSALVVYSTPAQGTDFAKQIAPILEMHCVKCHGPHKQQGGLRFDDVDGALKKGDSDEPAIVPGDATASELTV